MSSAATAIEVVPVAGALGAEIRGVDLRALDDDIFSSVHAALLEHEVIFFRGAHLTEDEQIELGRWFGQPTTSPMSRLFGITEPTLQTITDGPDSPLAHNAQLALFVEADAAAQLQPISGAIALVHALLTAATAG